MSCLSLPATKLIENYLTHWLVVISMASLMLLSPKNKKKQKKNEMQWNITKSYWRLILYLWCEPEINVSCPIASRCTYVSSHRSFYLNVPPYGHCAKCIILSAKRKGGDGEGEGGMKNKQITTVWMSCGKRTNDLHGKWYWTSVCRTEDHSYSSVAWKFICFNLCVCVYGLVLWFILIVFENA